LEPAKAEIWRYVGFVAVLGVAIICGNLFFKKLEKWLRRKRR